MAMCEIIRKRKSIRKYDPAKLDVAMLNLSQICISHVNQV